jgi:hypothetical protein
MKNLSDAMHFVLAVHVQLVHSNRGKTKSDVL